MFYQPLKWHFFSFFHWMASLYLKMAKHIYTGRAGEDLALAYFINKGYQVKEKNWRRRNWEVDLIASYKGILHFIEVKTKSSGRYGYPEDEVDTKKIRYLINAAEVYLFENPQWQRIQFDILAITLGKTPEYFLIEDVYL
jgi:putative endonuclease